MQHNAHYLVYYNLCRQNYWMWSALARHFPRAMPN
jgi:hypothetical protein